MHVKSDIFTIIGSFLDLYTVRSDNRTAIRYTVYGIPYTTINYGDYKIKYKIQYKV